MGEQILTEKDKRLKQILLEAIDEGLLMLGEGGKQSIHYHVETHYQIKREEICDRIEAFGKALENLFGAGAKLIEATIAKNLYERLGLKFESHEGWALVDYVNHARKAMAREAIAVLAFACIFDVVRLCCVA